MTLAAAITGLRFAWIKGIHGEDIAEKALPPGERNTNARWDGTKGCWRGHLNALQQIVERNLTTALVLEDDVDWDLRVKTQLQTFSLASRAFLQSLGENAQPVSGREALAEKQNLDIDISHAPYPGTPRNSPYGDDWDILWLGHIGAELPRDWKSGEHNKDFPPRSVAVVTIPDDHSVPGARHLKPHPFADQPDRFSELYPPHTRLVHESRNTIGAQAYAVSQRGARRLLWQFGVDSFTNGWDILLRDFCDGAYGQNAASRPVCLTVQPPLISHHYAKGGESDIHGVGGGYMRKVGKPIHSTQREDEYGEARAAQSPEDSDQTVIKDQWPDDAPGSW